MFCFSGLQKERNIRMIDQAHQDILDRQYVRNIVKSHYQESVLFLRTLTDYGSNFIFRAYNTSNQALTDIILIFSFLKQSVMNLDAISVLLEQGCADACEYPLRSLLEQSFYIEWLLSGDTDNKIYHYYVSHLRKMRASHNYSIDVHHHKKIPQTPTEFPIEIINWAKKENREIEEVLNDPYLKSINQEFEKFYKKRGFEPNWLKIYGVNSLKGIAVTLHKEEIYQAFYTDFSEFNHSNCLWKNVQCKDDMIAIEPIRRVERLPKCAQDSALFAISIYKLVLIHYRPEEHDDFMRKYHNEWKPRLDTLYAIIDHSMRQNLL
jgi:hypothetical protein